MQPRTSGNRCISLDLPLIVELLLKQGRTVHYLVTEGIPEGAVCTGAGVSPDGLLTLYFENEVPPTVEIQHLNPLT